MSEGYGTYFGLLRLYNGFASVSDEDPPPFAYDGSHPGLARPVRSGLGGGRRRPADPRPTSVRLAPTARASL